MDNDKSPSEYGEDEYQFTEPEMKNVYGESASTQKRSAANFINATKRRNIIIGIVVIIAIICIYKLLELLFSGHAHKPPQATLPTVSTQQTAAPAATPATMPAATMDNTIPSSVSNRVTTLEQRASDSQAAIDRINTQLNDVQNGMSTLQSQLAQMSGAVQAIATQMAQQQQQKAAKKEAAKRAQAAPRPVYYVKAMIPGRAWLYMQNGGTLTVGEGDTIPGYGVVQSINPDQGTVILSTGAIIGYAPQDR